jgi:hypothetical protein
MIDIVSPHGQRLEISAGHICRHARGKPDSPRHTWTIWSLAPCDSDLLAQIVGARVHREGQPYHQADHHSDEQKEPSTSGVERRPIASHVDALDANTASDEPRSCKRRRVMP